MHRTRVAAMAALVPVVAALVAAMIVAAAAGTTTLAVSGVLAGPPSGFRSEGGNRGW